MIGTFTLFISNGKCKDYTPPPLPKQQGIKGARNLEEDSEYGEWTQCR